MNRGIKNISPVQKFKRKNLLLRYSKYVILIVLSLLLLWFLFALNRILDLKEYYKILQKERFNNFIILPDSIPPIGNMPDFTEVKWQKLSSNLDSEGVKLTDYDASGIRGISGMQRHPSSIAGFAEQKLSKFTKLQNHEDLILALRQIDYLMDEFKPTLINGDTIGLWYVNFDLGYQYNVKAPWRSGFNQAFCLESMLYGFQVTGNFQYLYMFEKGINAYTYSTIEGGLSFKTKNGGLFFEEVVTSEPLHHILNGHMIALIKIYNCAIYTGSSEAMELFNRGVIGLKEMLYEYDRYGYSLYSLSPNPSMINHFNIASPHYHNVHIAQLRTLAAITGEKMFNDYANKWQSQAGGIKEFLWITVYVLFKDIMRSIKIIENKLGLNYSGK